SSFLGFILQHREIIATSIVESYMVEYKKEDEIEEWVKWQAKEARKNWLEDLNSKLTSELEEVEDVNSTLHSELEKAYSELKKVVDVHLILYSKLEKLKDEKREIESEKRITKEECILVRRS
ncbi:7881_t:CDS:1, partial [Racocetra persica]